MALLDAEPGTDTGTPPPAAKTGKEHRVRVDLAIGHGAVAAAHAHGL